jgi:hypothetical protein
MRRECAFCPNTANLTGEHLWSDWLNQLLPGKKRFNVRNEKREIIKTWTSPKLNWKAKVVCASCNSGWMSELENKHAKPALSELIVGGRGISIDHGRAKSIAFFAFKNAVVFDYLTRGCNPFFERSERHEFRRSLTIPPSVGVFIAGFAYAGLGEANTLYSEFELPPPHFLRAYVLTYSIERVVVQVAACRTSGVLSARVKNYFAIPIWPKPPDGLTWPPARIISTTAEFDELSDRWKTVTVTL